MEIVSSELQICDWQSGPTSEQSFSNHPPDRPTGGTTAGEQAMERLLSVDEVAGVLGTSDRFPRRLIAERRIRFVRVGRHVRIPVSALEEFVREGTVDPVVITWRSGRVA